MTVYFDKARKKWRYDFWLDGQRHVDYCVDPKTGRLAMSRREATAVQDAVRVALRAAKDEPVPLRTGGMTIAEAFSALAMRKKTSDNFPNIQRYVRELIEWFGPGNDVRTITDQAIWDYIVAARQRPVEIYIGGSVPKAKRQLLTTDPKRLWKAADDGRTRSDATINRYLDCLRQALKIAHAVRDGEGRRIALPVMPQIPDLKEPESLPRPISDADLWTAADLAPAHLAWAILLARLMGFRKAEMFNLRRQQLDWTNRGVWLRAQDTKAERDEFVPANDQAWELLTYLAAEAKARQTDYLITYRRTRTIIIGDGASGRQTVVFGPARPIKNPKKAWGRVLSDLGLKGIHTFHNTKASFVTALAHVAPQAVTQELARHRDYRTTQRYYRVADAAKREAVQAASMSAASSPGPTPKSHTGGRRERKP